MRRTWRGALIILASVSLAVSPGVLMAEAPSGGQATVDSAQPSGQGAEPTIKNDGTSASKADPSKGPSGAEVGDRLHDSAKGFGEALLDGIKYAGRKVIGFFSGDDKKKE
jgi:hypothetical protein